MGGIVCISGHVCIHLCAYMCVRASPLITQVEWMSASSKIRLSLSLSLSGGLSLLRWKEGEWSGPKALLGEAHFEAFNVWHTLTHCQKQNDLQTDKLTIEKVRWSQSTGPLTRRHTPITSANLWISILLLFGIWRSVWLPDTVGTIPFVARIPVLSSEGFSYAWATWSRRLGFIVIYL